MAPTAESLLDRASNTLKGGGTLGDVAAEGIGGFVLAVATGFISGFLTLADLFIKPMNALIGGIQGGIEAIFSWTMIVLSGAEASAASVAPGATFDIGPFTFALALVAVLLGGWVIARYLIEEETSDLIPFSFIDFPFVGQEEEADADD